MGPGRDPHRAPASRRLTSASIRPAAAPACRSRCSSRCASAADDPEDAAARATTVAAEPALARRHRRVGPHSREQAFVAALLTQAEGQADLPRLVEQILRPPFDRVGVMDLETFFPAQDRQALALRFNSVLATPGFDVWTTGEPPDLSSDAVHARRQASHRHRLRGPPGRRATHDGRFAGTECRARVDAKTGRQLVAAALALHGRSVRLPAAGGEPTVEAAAADAVEAGPGVRRRRHARDAESGRSGLQGALEHRHLVSRASCRRSATSRASSTASRACRARGRATSSIRRCPAFAAACS